MAKELVIYKTEDEAKAAASKGQIIVECNVETVLGQKLENKLTGYVLADQHETVQAARDSGDWPNDGQILKIVNMKAANNARQSAIAKMTADVKAKIEQTDEFKLNDLVKNILAKNPKLGEDKARKMAQSILAA